MSQMLYKNRTDRPLVWRCGTGPGSWTDYKAGPGKFCIAPSGYREQMRREGFTPTDELPDDERPDIPIDESSVTMGKVQRKVFVEDPEDGERLERAVPTRPLADLPVFARPQATRPTAPPPASRPQIDMSAAPADGPMALANVEPLPDLPPPPADEPVATPGVALTAKAVLAGDMSVETPAEPHGGAVAPAGAAMPAPPSERDTKPEKPSAKDKAKK